MQYDEKIGLLKKLRALKQIPERQLTALAEFLRPKPLADGAFVFAEGSIGMSLYFVSSGRIRITKLMADKTQKDLAILGPGEFFGEMALTAEAPRSAGAVASGACVLFELFRGDLDRWVKLNPQQAVHFFAELVHMQSERLRRTSNELTLHFNLGDLLADRSRTAPDFLTQVLERTDMHLEGPWSGAAYLCGADGVAALTASRGDPRFAEAAKTPAFAQDAASAWLDDLTFHVVLPGKDKPLGHLVFRAPKVLSKEDRDEIERALTAVSRLVSTGLEIHLTTNA